MPVTYEVVTTKPAGAKFFNQVSEENKAKSAEHSSWIATLPGFISQELVDTSDDVRTYTNIWDTIENYINWSTQQKNKPFVAERATYNKINGITFSYSEHIS
jgi:heme-degrading monooxygenase HmoA